MKVFGIGFHRTGTRSLHEFLTKLGYQAVHWPRWVDGECFEARCIPCLGDRGRIVAALRPLIERYQAFTDVPFPGLYRELHERYPASRFVLVTRDLDRWWRSVVHHWQLEHRPFRALDPYEVIQYDRYASPPIQYAAASDRERLMAAHRAHVTSVQEYFAGHHGTLVTVDLDDPEIGPKIADFLGAADPPEFPYLRA